MPAIYDATTAAVIRQQLEPLFLDGAFVFELVGGIKTRGHSRHDVDFAVHLFGKPFTRPVCDYFVWQLEHQLHAKLMVKEEETRGFGVRDGGQTLVQMLIPVEGAFVLTDFFFPRIK